MNIEFIAALLPADISALCEMDARIFADYPADLFSEDTWLELDSYWMVVDGQRVGCSAFVHDVDSELNSQTGCLYIMTTGLLPEFRGQGLGARQKAWQIDFAREHNFTRIVTNTRQSNLRMIALNEKFGFRQIGTVPDFYPDPKEASIVMALDLE